MTTPTLDEQDACKHDPTPKVIDPDAWKKMCPVELMAGNEQLAQWGSYWEQRALKAEQELDRIRTESDHLHDHLHDRVWAWTLGFAIVATASTVLAVVALVVFL